MRLNSLAFRLFAAAAVWTLLVLPLAGYMIYRLYRDDVHTTFDNDLRMLVTVFEIDTLTSGGTEPVMPINRYHPLFEVTHSGWYWQVMPLDDPAGRRLVSPSLATGTLPSPYAAKAQRDENGQRWMNGIGPAGRQDPHRRGARQRSSGPSGEQALCGGRRRTASTGWMTGFNAFLDQTGGGAGAGRCSGLLAMTLFQVRFGLLPLKKVGAGPGADPLRRGDQSRGRAAARDRAAAAGAQRAHSIEPGHRRPRAHAGRQSGARAEDAARRHHQRGARGQESVRRARSPSRRA